jgi:serine/threonine protein kinase
MVYEQLGVGGMAQVHRAISANPEFPSQIALKRMLSHLTSSEEMVRSFVREARLASYLRHKNVAQTYDLGRVGDIYFIAMELIAGRNLREVLRHCGTTTGPMPVPVALNILNQICDALDYAHNLGDETGRPLGIIHRDVSPSNIIVSTTGMVKLIDFGIAKASGAGLQTMSGTLKGKFAYMAPEYIGGQLDARADLFAVGVIAHELLTNRPLFSGRDDIDTLTRVREMPIDPPSKKNPKVPQEIDDVVMTALARDPERRWQHATALRCALTTLTQRLGMVATDSQAIQWLDWAFSQQRRPKRPTEPDTETDAVPIYDDEPSIVIEAPPTHSRSRGHGASPPPAETPLGTPAYAALPRTSTRAPTADFSRPGSERSRQARALLDAGPTTERRTRDLRAPSEAPPPSDRSGRYPRSPTDTEPSALGLDSRNRQPRGSTEPERRRAPAGSAPPASADKSGRYPRLPTDTQPSAVDLDERRESASERSSRHPRLVPSASRAPTDATSLLAMRAPPAPAGIAIGARGTGTASTLAGVPRGADPLEIPVAPRSANSSSAIPVGSRNARAGHAPSAPSAPSAVPVVTRGSDASSAVPVAIRNSPSSAIPVAVRGSDASSAVPVPARGSEASLSRSTPGPSATIHGAAAPLPSSHAAPPSARGGTGRPATAAYATSSPGAAPPASTHGGMPRSAAVHSTPSNPGRAPVPAIPSFNAAPLGAPRPSTPSQHQPVDPARSAIVQREFEQRASASARTQAAAAPAQARPMLAVALVVLAAAAAAVAVYFVLPLLT